jgi:DNA polymerase-3 subunit alpha
MFEGYAKIVEPVLSDRRAEATGQESFFGGVVAPALDIDESVLAGEEFEKREFLRYEKEMLGQYVTDHPLLAIRDRLARQTDLEISELASLGDGDVVRVAGIVSTVGRRFTKRGEPYALFRLEDLTGGIGIVAFPSVFDSVAHLLAPDGIVLVKGRADLRGRELQLVALEISEPNVGGEEGGETGTRTATGRNGKGDPLIVDLSPSTCTDGLISRLKELLAMHPGRLPVVFQLVDDGEVTRLRLGDEFKVDGSAALLSELRRLVGWHSVRLAEETEAAEPAAAKRPLVRS